MDLPEQEFSGFIKHADPARDRGAFGAGAYDSGQGSVGALSYAVRGTHGSWTRLLHPPGCGDLASERLPRDAEYSCPEAASWVCLPPVSGRGVWSTERIRGGGVRFGDHLLFIATLGCARARTRIRATPLANQDSIGRWPTSSRTSQVGAWSFAATSAGRWAFAARTSLAPPWDDCAAPLRSTSL